VTVGVTVVVDCVTVGVGCFTVVVDCVTVWVGFVTVCVTVCAGCVTVLVGEPVAAAGADALELVVVPAAYALTPAARATPARSAKSDATVRVRSDERTASPCVCNGNPERPSYMDVAGLGYRVAQEPYIRRAKRDVMLPGL
jgi:hypothetical protein